MSISQDDLAALGEAAETSYYRPVIVRYNRVHSPIEWGIGIALGLVAVFVILIGVWFFAGVALTKYAQSQSPPLQLHQQPTLPPEVAVEDAK